MHGVPIEGLDAAEALHVRLHAVEVEEAHAVVAGARKHSRPAVVHVQRGNVLALACSSMSSVQQYYKCTARDHTRCGPRPERQRTYPGLQHLRFVK